MASEPSPNPLTVRLALSPTRYVAAMSRPIKLSDEGNVFGLALPHIALSATLGKELWVLGRIIINHAVSQYR
jgi:hypothetical protein